MGFFDRLRKKPTPPADGPPDELASRLATLYPQGPFRRGSLRGVPRALDLTDKAPVIDEIRIYDAQDHWLCLFLGCRALGLPFEISLRAAKSTSDPPSWFVEPVTRVANAIGDGARCAAGVTWVIGSPLGQEAYTGFVTLPDLELGDHHVLQLVPISRDELDLRGNDLEQLCAGLESNRARMTGA